MAASKEKEAQCHGCGTPAAAGPDPLRPGRSKCLGCAAVSTLKIPGNPERMSPAPEEMVTGPAWPIAGNIVQDGALWRHQAQALEELDRGNNVVTATGTASGKSLIFQIWTLHLLMTEADATALVFYPTKALANDQAQRW